MTKKTESQNELFARLQQIRDELERNTNNPDLDNIMARFDEANIIEDKLNDFFEKTQKTIEEKRQKRNQS
tara:strand:- start:8325 stop:8534 length:210 start_codon:yes stop_codon:yes gene_type:complete